MEIYGRSLPPAGFPTPGYFSPSSRLAADEQKKMIPCPPPECFSTDPKIVWQCGSLLPPPSECFSTNAKNVWKCGSGSQQMSHWPVEYDFPEWFSNDIQNVWKSGSWEEYTNAADQLKVVKSDEGFYSLQKREDSPASSSCHEDLVSSVFRFFNSPYSKITKTDIKNFRLLLAEAEKDLQLFEDYFSPDGEGAMLQHDSTVEDVVERLPLRYLNNTEGPYFRPLLERLISMAKTQHAKELYRDYTLFLPNCDRIKSCTTVECLGMLKDDPHFLPKKFDDIEPFRLKQAMVMYLNYRDVSGNSISKYKAQMEQAYRCQRDSMWKARCRLPIELVNPIRFLAFQKRHKGYNVRHPVKEIMKFRSYFGQFLEGVPPPWRPKPQSPEPSQVGSSPSLERPQSPEPSQMGSSPDLGSSPSLERPQSPEPSQVGSSPSLERPKKRVRHC